MSRWRWLGALGALALVAMACTGTKPARKLASSPEPGQTEGVAATPAPGTGATAAPGAPAAAAPTRPRSTTRVTAPGQKPVTVTTGAGGVPVADLFPPGEDRVGITDREIVICMHAAFIFGDIFNNHPADETIYFDKVNAEEGGVFGRKVRLVFYDDAYQPSQAVTAAENCKNQGAFLMLSGIGFDQIPAVRKANEERLKIPYLYTMATEAGAQGNRYSWAVAPTIETAGRQVAQFAWSRNRGKKFAVIARNSDNWNGATDAFVSEVRRLGGEVVAVRKVAQNQGQYATELNDLRTNCPADRCVVFVNENVLAFAQIVLQAQAQQYRPQWINYGFNLVTDTLKEDAYRPPPIQAWFVTPAFDLYNETNQPWWPEIQAMKAAYAKYCTGNCSKKDPSSLNDVDWQFWLAWKSLHDLLRRCGPDCTRNKVAGLLLSGLRTKVDPLCTADFAKGGGRFGAHEANFYEAVRHSRTTAAFKQVETCRESFL